jgi:hypothetical protein
MAAFQFGGFRPGEEIDSKSLSGRQRALEERLGVGIASLRVVKLRQIVQRCSDMRMIGTERLFVYLKRAPVERLGVFISGLASRKRSPDRSGQARHADDRDRALFPRSPASACTAARRRHMPIRKDHAFTDVRARTEAVGGGNQHDAG